MVVRAALISSVVLFIIATASVFSWLMAIQEVPHRVAFWLKSLSDSPAVLLLLINVLLLVVGTFVETTAALILLVPVLVPLLPHLQIDLVQLGAIIIVNLSIGMLTPVGDLSGGIERYRRHSSGKSSVSTGSVFRDPRPGPHDHHLLAASDPLAAGPSEELRRRGLKNGRVGIR